jgi:hypothetical protein
MVANKIPMEEILIAPCGMNCGICKAYLRKKNKCPGCGSLDPYLRSYRRGCTVRNCETIKTNTSGFCYECSEFPCKRLKQLDKRYTTKYHMSMLENLDIIKNEGIGTLISREAEKWKCPECGGVISCHNGICYSCGGRETEKSERNDL